MSMTSGPAGPAAAARSSLGPGARLTGDLDVPGMIELVGHVEGRVTADAVVVEERGTVRGEVRAASIAVRGTFDGTLAGGAVRIQSTARVSGTVLYDTLAIESGAEVTAACRRSEAPPEGA